MICQITKLLVTMQILYHLGSFSRCFIDPKAEIVSKDSVAGRIKSDQHKPANCLRLKREL